MYPKPNHIVVESSDAAWIAEKHPAADTWQVWNISSDGSPNSQRLLFDIYMPNLNQHTLDQLCILYNLAYRRGFAANNNSR